MNNKLKILDVVALLKNIPEKKLIIGQVGTIVEVLSEKVFEVEFISNIGETTALAAVDSEDLLLLHYEFEPA